MKIVHPEIENHITFSDETFFGLIIENKKLFSNLATDLFRQTEGEEGNFVLSDNNVPIDINKNLELIYDFISFESNKKRLIGKITSVVEATLINEENYEKTQVLLSEIQRYFCDIFTGFSVDLECRKINVTDLVKFVGISLFEEELTLSEKILNYMEAVRDFEKDKIFVFVNMRSFFSYEQLNFFTKTALAHKFKFFMMDSYENIRLENETRILIDEDLCEI